MSKRYPSQPPQPKFTDDVDAVAPDPGSLTRLQKILATAGLGSRRACEEMITTGRVEIDGKIVTQLGTKVDPSSQIIRVDGETLSKPKLRYFVVNKPLGVLCTNDDPAGRMRVIDLVRSEARLFPVGRLDKSSEGLLIVTNDGELANLLAHPRYGVEKTYLALVAGEPDPSIYQELQEGVHLAEGWAHAKRVRVKAKQQHSTLLEITLDEGRNREVRRLLARVGHKVLRLQRIAQGSLKLGPLAPGEYRPLTSTEVQELKQHALDSIGKPKPKRPKKPRKIENSIPADEIALYEQEDNYQDDIEVSSAQDVELFFAHKGRIIGEAAAEQPETDEKPKAKRTPRVVPGSKSLKPLIDLRVKKSKPAKSAPVKSFDDTPDDIGDDGDFTEGFPGVGEAAPTEETAKGPRREMRPSRDKKRDASSRKRAGDFRRERERQGGPGGYGNAGGGERRPRSYGNRAEGEQRPAYGERRPYTPRDQGAGEAGGERRPYDRKPGGFGKRPFAGKRSTGQAYGERRPYTPRDQAAGDAGGERRPYDRKPGGFGKQPFAGKRSTGQAYGERRPYTPREDGANEGGEEQRSAGRKPGGFAKRAFGGQRTAGKPFQSKHYPRADREGAAAAESGDAPARKPYGRKPMGSGFAKKPGGFGGQSSGGYGKKPGGVGKKSYGKKPGGATQHKRGGSRFQKPGS